MNDIMGFIAGIIIACIGIILIVMGVLL